MTKTPTNKNLRIIDFGSYPDRYALIRDYGKITEETLATSNTLKDLPIVSD
jgi:hypothetical protein